jgi:hypothetical protein
VRVRAFRFAGACELRVEPDGREVFEFHFARRSAVGGERHTFGSKSVEHTAGRVAVAVEEHVTGRRSGEPGVFRGVRGSVGGGSCEPHRRDRAHRVHRERPVFVRRDRAELQRLRVAAADSPGHAITGRGDELRPDGQRGDRRFGLSEAHQPLHGLLAARCLHESAGSERNRDERSGWGFVTGAGRREHGWMRLGGRGECECEHQRCHVRLRANFPLVGCGW